MLGALPIPVFCTDLSTGDFQVINTEFARLFNYENPHVMLNVNAKELYRKKEDREKWIGFLNKSIGDGRQYSSAYILDLFNRAARKRTSVAEITRVLEVGGKRYAVGFAFDVSEHQLISEMRANSLAAIKELLDNEDLNIGVHRLISQDGEIRVKDLNRRAWTLVGAGDDWWNRIQSVSSLEENPATGEILKTLNDGGGLRKNHFCTYIEHNSKGTRPSVPVIINEYGIRHPAAAIGIDPEQNPKLCGILTAVRDTRIPDDIISLLNTYGPRNPMLEDAGVNTLVKVPIDAKQTDLEFEFRFANLPVKRELVRRGRLKAQPSSGPEPGVRYDADGIESVDGKSEEQLFDEYGQRYKEVDALVFGEKVEIQLIEDHPVLDASDTLSEVKQHKKVHVVKIPHKDENGEVVSIEVYFWDVTREEEVFGKLRTAYRPWNYLDDIPVPIYRKDSKLRFIYCNTAYVDDIKKISKIKINSVRDIIGLDDWQIHKESDAHEYVKDDRWLIDNPSKTIERIERHGDDWVKVIKTAIGSSIPSLESSRPGQSQVVAIQGIFWKLDPAEMQQFLRMALPTSH